MHGKSRLNFVLRSLTALLASSVLLFGGDEIWARSTLKPLLFFVSPDGNDRYPGTFSQPFRSLPKARDVIRSLNDNMTRDIVVFLRGGTHQLASTFVLTPEDSGTNGYNIIYMAYPGEQPVISGGQSIIGWSVFDADLNIYRASIGDKLSTRQLFVNGIRSIRARGADNPSGFVKTTSGYITSDQTMQDWGNLNAIEFVYRRHWVNPRCGVEQIVGVNIRMRQPCFDDAQRLSSIAIDQPNWIENAFELLDSEGEWYLDNTTGYIYYKPRHGEAISTAVVIAPTLEGLIVGKGTADNPIHHIHFKGLTFAFSTWLQPSGNKGFAEMQANYTWTGSQPAAVEFTFAQNMRFEWNEFTHLGAGGLRLGSGSQNNKILGNRFNDISGVAISIGGVSEFDRRNLESSTQNNTVANNLIRKIGVEYEGAPAILVGFTSGTSILHNEIEDVPYSGISVGWGWGRGDPTPVNPIPSTASKNVIAFNHIYSFMNVLTDGGGVYTLGSQPNSVITNNYIHDQRNDYGAIYLDEGSQYFSVSDNVLAANLRWLYIWTHTIQNNIVQRNYSDTWNFTSRGDKNVISDNYVVTGDEWPEPAQQIIKQAGLEAIYRSIRWDQPDVDLAFQKLVTTSSARSIQAVGSKGNDGDDLTAWIANDNDHRAWWQADLGAACWIDSVEMKGRSDRDEPEARRNFEVWVSNVSDFATYQVAAQPGTVSFVYESVWKAYLDLHEPFRYVRIVKSTSEKFSFAEFRVLRSATNPYCNVAIANPVSVSSTWSTQFVASFGNDGLVNTGWSPAADFGQPWWQVDLGAAHLLTTVELVARQDLDQPETRQNFEIWASNTCDFSTYEVIGRSASTPFNHQSTHVFELDKPESFRYIRVTKTIAQYFYLSELRAWTDQPTVTDTNRPPVDCQLKNIY